MNERNLKKILVEMLHQHHLLSVGDILLFLEKKGKNFNKTSVYRSLEQLLSEGTVCRHYFNEAQALYELSANHHSHLVCTSCGAVSEAPCTYTQPKKVGTFIVDHHHLSLIGTCHKCNIKSARASS